MPAVRLTIREVCRRSEPGCTKVLRFVSIDRETACTCLLSECGEGLGAARRVGLDRSATFCWCVRYMRAHTRAEGGTIKPLLLLPRTKDFFARVLVDLLEPSLGPLEADCSASPTPPKVVLPRCRTILLARIAAIIAAIPAAAALPLPDGPHGADWQLARHHASAGAAAAVHAALRPDRSADRGHAVPLPRVAPHDGSGAAHGDVDGLTRAQ